MHSHDLDGGGSAEHTAETPCTIRVTSLLSIRRHDALWRSAEGAVAEDSGG